MNSTISKIRSDQLDDIRFEYRLPSSEGAFPVIILLHGWTGDEKSMWVFSSTMPENHLLIAPRGLFSSSLGGYSWYRDQTGQWPTLDDFMEAFQAIEILMHSSIVRDHSDSSVINLVGFSQGAALAYAYSLQKFRHVHAIAGLSGFVPNGVQEFIYAKPLSGIRIFVTHGINDKIVPIVRARNGVSILQELGAQVTYCEEDSGHRLSPSCFRGLQRIL